jgi:hypothetical protein
MMGITAILRVTVSAGVAPGPHAVVIITMIAIMKNNRMDFMCKFTPYPGLNNILMPCEAGFYHDDEDQNTPLLENNTLLCVKVFSLFDDEEHYKDMRQVVDS